MRWAIVALVLLGCEDRQTECRSSASCIDRDGMPGLCAQMRCAFRDDSCTSLYRWDDSAGSLAGMCVDPSLIPLPDARPRDAR